jgi:hypothetical protein
MFTAWVTLTTGQRPRRTHRMGLDGMTKCGIQTRFRIKFVTRGTRLTGFRPHPPFCHVCFKYKYRFWTQQGREHRVLTDLTLYSIGINAERR